MAKVYTLSQQAIREILVFYLDMVIGVDDNRFKWRRFVDNALIREAFLYTLSLLIFGITNRLHLTIISADSEPIQVSCSVAAEFFISYYLSLLFEFDPKRDSSYASNSNNWWSEKHRDPDIIELKKDFFELIFEMSQQDESISTNIGVVHQDKNIITTFCFKLETFTKHLQPVNR